jgi:hypothetical protein
VAPVRNCYFNLVIADSSRSIQSERLYREPFEDNCFELGNIRWTPAIDCIARPDGKDGTLIAAQQIRHLVVRKEGIFQESSKNWREEHYNLNRLQTTGFQGTFIGSRVLKGRL